MAAILATATAAAITAGAAGSVDWAVAAVLASGSAVGAYIGTRLLDHISEVWLAVAFSVLATVSAIRLFIGSGEETSPVTTVDWSPRLAVSLVLVGLVAGTLAALLGVGGGIIYVPAMVLLLGISQHVAQGSSSPPSSHRSGGDAGQPAGGRVDKRAAVVVGLGGVAAGDGRRAGGTPHRGLRTAEDVRRVAGAGHHPDAAQGGAVSQAAGRCG